MLIALESACGIGVRFMSVSLNELDMAFISLASGSGVPPRTKPGFKAAGVVMPPFNALLVCLDRFFIALFMTGVNSVLAFGLRILASGSLGVRVPFALENKASRPAGG